MSIDQLAETALAMVAAGKGIIAMTNPMRLAPSALKASVFPIPRKIVVLIAKCC